MNLAIRRVSDAGNLAKERLVLYAESDVDVGRFILCRSTVLGEGEVSTKIRSSFWLPDLSVNAGDLVIIYTKSGKNSTRTNNDGSKSHFLYRGLTGPLWNEDNACAVLFETEDWEMKKV